MIKELVGWVEELKPTIHQHWKTIKRFTHLPIDNDHVTVQQTGG
jgi:hypothetical protein